MWFRTQHIILKLAKTGYSFWQEPFQESYPVNSFTIGTGTWHFIFSPRYFEDCYAGPLFSLLPYEFLMPLWAFFHIRIVFCLSHFSQPLLLFHLLTLNVSLGGSSIFSSAISAFSTRGDSINMAASNI